MSQSSIICEPLEDTSATVSRTRAFQALCGVDLQRAQQGLSQRQISNFTHCVKRQSQQSAVAKRVIGLSTVYAIVSLPQLLCITSRLRICFIAAPALPLELAAPAAQ